MYRRAVAITLAAGAWLTSCDEAQDAHLHYEDIPCEAAETVEIIRVHCGLSNPTDMVVVPGEQVLLISQTGEFLNHDSTGSLVAFDIASERVTPLSVHTDAVAIWGDTECRAPSLPIHPQGLHLSTNEHGQSVLAVVNHYPREAIELLELMPAAPGGAPQLVWRGCLPAPADYRLHSVVRLPDDRYFATHMFDLTPDWWNIMLDLVLENDVGALLEWAPGRGWQDRGNDGLTVPTGIAVNADATELYISDYLGEELVVYDLARHAFVRRYPLPAGPVHLKMADEQLWVTGHEDTTFGHLECDSGQDYCLLPFSIHTLDVRDAHAQPQQVLAHNGRRFGYGSAAVPAGDRLWVGAIMGNRMGSVPLGRRAPR